VRGVEIRIFKFWDLRIKSSKLNRHLTCSRVDLYIIVFCMICQTPFQIGSIKRI
jgi:hypothetical protein